MRDELNCRTAITLMTLVISCWATVAAANEGHGNCSPCQEPNGRGIYINREADYCVQDKEKRRFCPEAFVQTHDGVELKGRRFPASANPAEEYVESYKLSATFELGPNQGATPVILTRVTTGPRLSFRFRSSNGMGEASGANLHKLRISINEKVFPLSAALTFVEHEVALPGKHGRSYWYEGKWDSKEYCSDKNRLFLLPGKSVDAQRGRVTNAGTGTVTLACQTGAIAKCMDWGYNPSAISFADDVENQLLGACIQAKRAAYFARFGDFESYTVDGKKLNIKDREGVLTANPRPLEAVWTEDGALCFNRDLHRAIEVDIPKPPQEPLECGDEFNRWFGKGGILATGQYPQK
ncbi:ADYC domain-containing protein [Hyalangium versicolor]|uniref:ADYC domain-containing protein n=1 Tax=Hyalangium versicolor TaxID=2861190 RepID=UPI001CCEC743|nr:ADYC domain-containing protein [Hyalangium versicolor]